MNSEDMSCFGCENYFETYFGEKLWCKLIPGKELPYEAVAAKGFPGCPLRQDLKEDSIKEEPKELYKLKPDTIKTLRLMRSGNRCDLTQEKDETEKAILEEEISAITDVLDYVKSTSEKLSKTGHWEAFRNDVTFWYECSECGFKVDIYHRSNYCLKCGISMQNAGRFNDFLNSVMEKEQRELTGEK